MAGLDVEIVGVVDDVRAVTLADAPPPMAFFPLAQRPVAARALDVRTAGAPETAAAAVRRALASAAPDVPVESIMTMDERVHRGLSQTRLVVFLTSGFGGVALGLAGFGLFGVLSYAVATRTRELGVRMALGASPARVVRGVVGDGLWLVLGGVLLGLPFVLLAGRLAATLVSGIGAHDAPAIAAAAGTLFAVGAACGLGPALKASRVDPMETLRAE
jgi:hypothetical protein